MIVSNKDEREIADSIKLKLLNVLNNKRKAEMNKIKAIDAHINWINNDNRFISSDKLDDNYKTTFVPEGVYLNIKENAETAINISLSMYGKDISKIDDVSWSAHMNKYIDSALFGISFTKLNKTESDPMKKIEYDKSFYHDYYEKNMKNKK